jgi:hypothetical protein
MMSSDAFVQRIEEIAKAAKEVSQTFTQHRHRAWVEFLRSAFSLASLFLIPVLIVSGALRWTALNDAYRADWVIAFLFIAALVFLVFAIYQFGKNFSKGWLLADHALVLFSGRLVGDLTAQVSRLKEYEKTVVANVTPYLLPFQRTVELERHAQVVRCITSNLEWAAHTDTSWTSNDNVLGGIVIHCVLHNNHQYRYLIFKRNSDDEVRKAIANARLILRMLNQHDLLSNIMSDIDRTMTSVESVDQRRAQLQAVRGILKQWSNEQLIARLRTQIQLKFLKRDDDGKRYVVLPKAESDVPEEADWKRFGEELPLFSDLVIYEGVDVNIDEKRARVGNSGATLALISSLPTTETINRLREEQTGFDYLFRASDQWLPVRSWFNDVWDHAPVRPALSKQT